MSIDISKEPIAIFTELLNSKNPSTPDFTVDEIAVRRITSTYLEDWPRPEDKGADNFLPSYPAARYISPTKSWSDVNGRFVIKKELVFKGGDVLCHARADNIFNIYIDGVLMFTADDYLTVFTKTIHVDAGIRTVVIECVNGTGGAGVACAFDDAGVVYVTDVTWPCKVTTGTDVQLYTAPTNEATVDVDLLIEPSEAYGDFVNFKYERIPVNVLFGGVDVDTATKAVELEYHVDDIDMLLGAVDNFKSVYENWYRFSHNASGVYPANASELQGWKYIEEFDCVESTINSGTYVGFISDNFETDYEFNTVVTSLNNDDDMISLCLGAFKQGDIDDKEHTLSLNISCGGWNGSYIRVNEDTSQTGGKVTRIIDPNTNTPNSGGENVWAKWYAHAYAKRVGSKITIWVKRAKLPALEAGQTRDEMILQMVQDLSTWKETDFIANGYMTTVIDLEVEATIFNRPTRSGYGQFSQAAARFWNIRRPGDNPSVTPKLHKWFLDRYNYNMGTDGIEVENLGVSKFRLSFDNIVYHRSLDMMPTNVRKMMSAEDLIANGIRFSHDGSDVQPAKPAEMAGWTTKDGDVYFPAGVSHSGIVTPYAATEYEFHTGIRSESNHMYPISIVLAYVVEGGREHTLILCADVPEAIGNGEWSIYYNIYETTQKVIHRAPMSEVAYIWSDISERNIHVKRVGDTITVYGNNKESEPGTDYPVAIDLNSDPLLAKFKVATHFGYSCYTQAESYFRNILV